MSRDERGVGAGVGLTSRRRPMSGRHAATLTNIAVLSCNFCAAVMVISLNKRAFRSFPFPAALTCLHYFISWGGVTILHRCGVFEAQTIPVKQKRHFGFLVVFWSVCNALSNTSLDRNSVGFYQLTKLMVTPSLVAFDFIVYGRHTSLPQALALALSCVGVGVASINDVQFHLAGAIIATAATFSAATQKVLNSHVQQVGGLTSLQVMQNAFPAMSFMALFYVPLMDRRIHKLFTHDGLFNLEALLWIVASGVAAFLATWSATAIFGRIGALSHVLLGQVKTCSVLLVGWLLYDAQQTLAGLLGASIALASITAYSIMKLPTRDGALMQDSHRESERSGSVAKDGEDSVLLHSHKPNESPVL